MLDKWLQLLHQHTMRIRAFAPCLMALTLLARADEKLSTLTVGNDTYTNVTITKVTATDIFFIYHGGMGNAKIKKLSSDLQAHFQYDPDKAKGIEQKRADDQVKYHQQLLHQAAPTATVQSPGSSPHPDPAPATRALWRSDYPGALKQAQSEKKFLLLDFTGSDWCPWCIKFDHDILSTPKFAAYAAQKLVLVKVDFPRHTQLPEQQRQDNEALSKQFGVDGFPTFLLLNSDGNEIGRQVSYLEGGPDAFIAELEKFSGR